jgi:hypothetical protein
MLRGKQTINRKRLFDYFDAMIGQGDGFDFFIKRLIPLAFTRLDDMTDEL